MKEHFIVLVTTTPSLHASTRELASRLAERSHAVLLFLHILPMQGGDGVGMLYGALEISSGQQEAWVRSQTPVNRGVRYRHRFEVGPPEAVIAKFVDNHDVDMIVVEEPPRNWVARTLWRGFAERLIHHLKCPVVIGGPGFQRAMQPAEPPVRTALGTETVAELLNAMVDARADALRRWMDHAADAVQRVALSLTVQTAMQPKHQSTERMDRTAEQRMIVELGEHQRALRSTGWQVTSGKRLLGSASVRPAPGPSLQAFLQRVERYGHSTSLPMIVADAPERLMILAGAMLAEGGGVLLFSFDAESEFLRILGQPGPLPSFETYAFDETGLMLSNSRFPEHLLEAGLLLAGGAQTPLRLRVAEPADGPIDSWPLTHLVQQATRHNDGFNTAGYRDYRGTPVVGAWRWIPEYGFGVAAEVDQDAAFR